MRSTTMVRSLAAALASVLAVQARTIPGDFILQYHDNHDPSTVLDEIKREHDLEVRRELHFKLFKGVQVRFRNLQTAGSAAAEVGAMRGVKGMWPTMLHARPKMSISQQGNGVMGHGPMKRDVQHDNFSPHVMTQVNLLRDAGYTGKGFKVAIIDSGVDYLHPALGGGFGPGYLVSFGTDLVGDDFNGTNTPVPDSDPMDTCDGHGSHVAGIIAAQPDKNPYGIIGAASQVKIGMYRAFGCGQVSSGLGTDDGTLIAAYHQAFEDGADLIHASVVEDGGWTEGAWNAAVSTIIAHGVPCTVAAGNEGANGLFSGSNPAGAVGAAAVGSIENVLSPSMQVNATYSVNHRDPVSFGFTPGLPNNWTAKTLPLWTPVSNVSDITNEAIGCDPYPDTTPNLGGYIVLVPNGACASNDKARYAAQWGAKHMLLYNFRSGTPNFFNDTDVGIPVGLVSQDQGAEWVKLLLSGAKVDVNMVDVATAPVVLENINNTRSGGYMSTFTSWGPTFELAIKPQFSAPGQDILSTYPRALGSYAVDSGTSMAGPLVAAIYVLLMEATSIRDPGMLGRLLSSTAKQLDYNDGLQTRVGLPAPVAQQGAGMVQAFEASRARAVLDVESLSFNDTEHFVSERNFTITNLSNVTLQYRLYHTPALTAYTFDDDESVWPSVTPFDAQSSLPNELVPGHATLEFSPRSFSVPGGKKRVVSVRVTKPADLDHGRLPVWSGWIGLNGTDGSKLSLPYQGVTGSLRDRHVMDINNTGLAGVDGLLLGPRTFLLPPAGKANLTRWSDNTDTSQPVVAVPLALGSRLIRADLIPVHVPDAKFNLTTILGTQTVGSIANWPVFDAARGYSVNGIWDGMLDDGSYAPEGDYKINIKALRIFGDPTKRRDYDEVETVKFAIRYASDI